MKTRKLTEKPKSLNNINLIRALRRTGIIQKQIEWHNAVAAARPYAKKLVKDRHKSEIVVSPHPTLSGDEIKNYVEKQIRLIHIVEDKFDNKLRQFITKMVDGFLVHLEQEVATTKNFANKDKDYFSDNEDDLLAEAQLDFTPLLSDMALLAGDEALRLIKSKEIYLPIEYKKIIADNVEKFTQSMLDTDRQTLIDIISNGIANGESTGAIRDTIKADFDAITKSQATRITKTEIARTANQAAIDAWKQSGVVEGLQWTVVNPVDECADYDGQIRSLDDSGFYDVENDFQDGDPPLHPNCECQLIPIVIDSEKAYVAQVNKAMAERIKELESQIDKRTKEYREIKEAKIDGEMKLYALQAVVDAHTKSMLNENKESNNE